MSLYYIIAPLLLSFIISLLVEKILIPILKSKKLGQKILDIGPRWHKSKEGIPTMGGLAFIVSIFVTILIFGLISASRSGNYKIIIIFVMAVCYGILGFIDDYVKLVKKQNEGLTPRQKLVFQFLIAIIFVFTMRALGYISTETYIPFAKIYVNLGFFYYIFLVVGLVYFTNSTNITDGIDGLCGTVSSVAAVFFIFAFYIFASGDTGDSVTGVILSSALFGGLLGFLYYNIHPAKIIMGDTGSIFLGGIIGGMAIWLEMPIILIILGIVYIVEALSSMIQVTYYKMTKKRIFKMAPIHHHYEMCGWSEAKIVIVFGTVTLIGAVISFIGIM